MNLFKLAAALATCLRDSRWTGTPGQLETPQNRNIDLPLVARLLAEIDRNRNSNDTHHIFGMFPPPATASNCSWRKVGSWRVAGIRDRFS